ncbi:NADH-ubiquinone oxidoreductase (complex I), chain 5 [Cucumis melo var. makuwa]|uniref:NADH-ubiquinone oxidoreductase (Complex I), chain 5 n=1 Tax=Cucumis melo var. makuwa TaxID=1194695 RepID=A0A5D3DVI9_CUCMM|nr:NADH-ubiquinone oxidoreductase (complex I), chain 5 [Cucumis melo var. makuwa]TYK27827.1 NADH-ubiquinone oxidoreductase (complex I), chain 5 [Cucumis melo var. makuwa]
MSCEQGAKNLLARLARNGFLCLGKASSSSAQPIQEKKVGESLGGEFLSKPPVLVRSGPWSSVSALPADKIFEIDQPAGLLWLFLSIEKESAVCASNLLIGFAGRHGILVQI